METVKSLRQKGWKVRVLHLRNKGFKTYDPGKFDQTKRVLEKGGTTVLQLTCPNGSNFEGVAVCSEKDNYNKKLGVKIALGRSFENPVNTFTFTIN